MLRGISRVAACIADCSSPATLNVTNPHLQLAVTAQSVLVRLNATSPTPTPDRLMGMMQMQLSKFSNYFGQKMMNYFFVF